MTAGAGIAGVGTEARHADYVPGLSYHEGSDPAAGPHRLTITVGPISTRLEGLAAEHAAALRRRHGRLISSEDAADIVLSIRRAADDGFLRFQPELGERTYRVNLSAERGAVLATSYDWAGWFDEARGLGGLALAPAAAGDVTAFERALENFLRVVHAHAILARGGMLLHAAGLVRDGRAYLFFGPSGAGKTTVTALTPEATILSDDLTLILPAGDGSFGACSVPFRGLFAPIAASREVWPLAGLFRLVQDLRDFLVPLKGTVAVGELVASLPFVTETPEAASSAIEVAGDVARTVPVHKLHFRKDRTFWDVIDEEMARSGRAGKARW